MTVLKNPTRIPKLQPWEILLLMGLCIVLGTLCLLHAGMDRTPPSNDDARYLQTSFELNRSLGTTGLKNFLRSLVRVTPEKPPLIGILPILFYPFSEGATVHTAKHSLAVSLVVLTVFTFLLARRFMSGIGALAAAILASTTPLAVNLSQIYYAELPTSACLVAFIYFVERSKLFTRRTDNIFAGLFFTLGILLKIFFIFIGGIVIIIVLSLRLRNSPELRSLPGIAIFGAAAMLVAVFGISLAAGASGIVLTIIAGFVIVLIAALAYFGKKPWKDFLACICPGVVLVCIIAGPWYVTNGHTAWQHHMHYALGSFDPADQLSVRLTSIWHFLLVLFNDTFGILLITTIIGLVVWFIVKFGFDRSHLPPKSFWILIAAWGVIPLLAFLIFPRRVARVALPLVPAYAIAAGALLSVLYAHYRRTGLGVIIAIAVLSLANTVYISFGPEGGGITLGRFYIVREPNPPVTREWSHSAILSVIEDYQRFGLRRLVNIRHTPTMNADNLKCMGALMHRRFEYYGYKNWMKRGYFFPGEKPNESDSSRTSKPPLSLKGMYIIDNRIPGETESNLAPGVADFRKGLHAAKESGHIKELIKPYLEPDGSKTHIWISVVK
ncbi:MAG: glycosyltransferase family 39 protein [Planctomycetota bacterium]|jgi:4-amino-4-deoxy-L-arabinose transferase-like glycosyltransferase